MSRDKDLVQLIRDGKVKHFVVDNDCWWGKTSKRSEKVVVEDGEVKPLGDGGYGSGHCYGGDILQALAVIAGVTIESV